MTKYSGDVWRDALSTAEENEFCEIDSTEHGGDAAAEVAEIFHDIAPDEELLSAAIAVAEALQSEFDRAFLAKVIEAQDELAEQALEERATGFIMGRWPGFPLAQVRDLERLAVDFALHPHERAAFGSTSRIPYVFNVSSLVAKEE